MSNPLDTKVASALEHTFTELQDSYLVQMNLDLLAIGELPKPWYELNEIERKDVMVDRRERE